MKAVEGKKHTDTHTDTHTDIHPHTDTHTDTHIPFPSMLLSERHQPEQVDGEGGGENKSHAVLITRSTVTLNFLLATLEKVKKKLVMSMS